MDSARSLPAVLNTAADILQGLAPPSGEAADFLAQLEYLDGAQDAAGNRAALLRAAAGFRRLFALTCDDAPGLVALGAEVDAPMAAGVSGVGLTFRQAFEACAGEAVEYLSQFPIPTDPIEVLAADEALAQADAAMQALWQRLSSYRRAEPIAWTAAADLATGRPIRIPADLCFRRAERDLDPPYPLSIGCAAAPDLLNAALRGLLELVERDAVSLWQRGGHRPRLLPPGIGAETLARLRGAATRRRTWLLDITSDLTVPVVAALSCNPDGHGLCVGHAARPRLEGAATAALLEMAQMELAHQVALRKREERGEEGLNELDRRHLRRYAEIKVAAIPLLHPVAPPDPPADLPDETPVATLAAVRQRLHAVGLSACVVNLTRPALGVAVTRAFCAGLEVGIAAPPGPRLLAMAEHTGFDWRTSQPL